MVIGGDKPPEESSSHSRSDRSGVSSDSLSVSEQSNARVKRGALSSIQSQSEHSSESQISSPNRDSEIQEQEPSMEDAKSQAEQDKSSGRMNYRTPRAVIKTPGRPEEMSSSSSSDLSSFKALCMLTGSS